MMDLTGIVSISGLGGLFQAVSSTKFGLIVENIAEKKRIPAYSHQKISSLADIAIYTDTEEVPLGQVFANIFDKEKGGKADISKSSSEEVKKYFEAVLPNFDRERVYVSDMKKVINWYNILQENNMLKKVEENTENKEVVAAEVSEQEETKEAKPKKAKKASKKEQSEE